MTRAYPQDAELNTKCQRPPVFRGGAMHIKKKMERYPFWYLRQTLEKIVQALNGYKDGTYGGVMKNIMKGQVATKTDAEIDALATFISNL